jgi:hypothetical protein
VRISAHSTAQRDGGSSVRRSTAISRLTAGSFFPERFEIDWRSRQRVSLFVTTVERLRRAKTLPSSPSSRMLRSEHRHSTEWHRFVLCDEGITSYVSTHAALSKTEVLQCMELEYIYSRTIRCLDSSNMAREKKMPWLGRNQKIAERTSKLHQSQINALFFFFCLPASESFQLSSFLPSSVCV